MEHFQKFAMERIRFQTLIVDLARSLDEHQDAASLQIAVLSFVNAIINYKAGEVSCNVQRRFIYTMIAVPLPVNNNCPVATDYTGEFILFYDVCHCVLYCALAKSTWSVFCNCSSSV